MDNKVPLSKNMCTGCTACANICPTHAIQMREDKEGFLYPQIDDKLCINCGLCIKNCSFCKETLEEDKVQNTAFLAKHKSNEVRMNSRSGGVFVACSDWILEKNGVVYGCILNDNMKAIHTRATTVEDRNKMCKSKYVQSETIDIFPKVKEDLSQNKFVLFSGTGCQVDGLLVYLKQQKVNTDKLYTMDLVCHGCASPIIFKNYIEWLENKYKSKIEKFDFRDKSIRGWDGHIESYTVKGKKKVSTIYREIFHTDLCLRPSCYNCKYANLNRVSDLTIADAWGIKEASPDFYDNMGASMFLVQSKKGNELVEIIKGTCDIIKVPIEKIMQPNLEKPSKAKGNREEFWQIFYKDGIDAIIKKYGKLKLSKNIKEKLKYKARKILLGKKIYLP